jgi:hypothetical protein
MRSMWKSPQNGSSGKGTEMKAILFAALLVTVPVSVTAGETCETIEVPGHENTLCTQRWVIPATAKKPASLCHISYFERTPWKKMQVDCDPIVPDPEPFDFDRIWIRYCDILPWACMMPMGGGD